MSMDVQFWYTRSDKVGSLPIQNGRIIALSDKPGYYYDMNDRRYRVNNIEFVQNLPDLSNITSTSEENTDTQGLLDLMYMTPNGIYRYKDGKFVSLLPVDVKEAPKTGYVYGRNNGVWNRLRWIFASDSNISAHTINSRISNLLSGSNVASIKIVGKVNLNDENLAVNTEGLRDVSVYLDLTDTEMEGSNHIAVTSGADTTICISGTIQSSVSIGGSGAVKLENCAFHGDVQVSNFSGTLSMNGCTSNGKTISYSRSILPKGKLLISGCTFNSGEISIPSDDYCISLISGNLLHGVTVTRGDLLVDALYNNVG